MFNFTEGDIVTTIAQEEHLIQRCHALVWHSQLAPWVEAQNWTAEELSSIIVNHITNVVEHYKGKCYAWDVVNEALNEDGTYRESIFYTTLGEEYIKLAFSTASKVDPEAKLYYNDYNLESPGNKSEGAVRIVKLLQDNGIKISGVGMQAHFTASQAPTLDQQIAVINSYAALGLEVAYTELDVRIELPLNDTNLAWQKQAYTNVSRFSHQTDLQHFKLINPCQAAGACVQSPACVGMTIWDFYDPFSWVPAVFSGQGNPLLWFEDFSKHPAYYGVIEAFKNETNAKPCSDKPHHARDFRRSNLPQ